MTQGENTKRKMETRTRGKVVGYVGLPQSNDEKETEQVRRKEFWSEAVSELEQSRFSSVEEALYALVGHAMKRLALDEDEETREFLYDLLNMDPEFRGEVERSLNIVG